MNNKLVGMLVCTLLLFNFSTIADSNNFKRLANRLNTTSFAGETDLPIWDVGDSWTYDIKLDCVYPQFSFQGDLKDIDFAVAVNMSDSYRIEFNGDVIGELSIEQDDPPISISGDLKSTTIDGYSFVEKTNLGIKELHVLMDGFIKLPLVPVLIPLTVEIAVTFDPAYAHLNFPISVGKQWTVMFSDVLIQGNISIAGIIERSLEFDTSVGGDTAQCISKENLTVEAGTYDTFKILSCNGSTEIYYAPMVANVVKLIGSTSNFDSIELELKSTTYTIPGAPNKPNKPSGPTSGIAGVEYTYTTSTTDPNGDQVYYKWNWGDGTDSSWLGPYNSSETVYASHVWWSNGEYVIRVKAKDSWGKESEWSEELTVLISDGRVNVTITCPRDGLYFMGTKIIDLPTIIPGQLIPFSVVFGSITITASVTGDGVNYVEFNTEDVLTNATETYKDYTSPYEWSWNGSTGVYIIAAVAKDSSLNTLDEDLVGVLKIFWSGRSDLLAVTMPKNKAINTPFLNFLENHPHMFPPLRHMLGL